MTADIIYKMNFWLQCREWIKSRVSWKKILDSNESASNSGSASYNLYTKYLTSATLTLLMDLTLPTWRSIATIGKELH